MNEIVKSIHLVKMYVWERPFQIKVERVRRYVVSLFRFRRVNVRTAFRRETFYVICQSLVNTVKIANGQTFPSTFFLVIFGLLWYQKAAFDTDFFTIAFVLVSYLRHTYLHNFSSACTNLSQYWVASKRIEVGHLRRSGIFNCLMMIAGLPAVGRIQSLESYHLRSARELGSERAERRISLAGNTEEGFSCTRQMDELRVDELFVSPTRHFLLRTFRRFDHGHRFDCFRQGTTQRSFLQWRSSLLAEFFADDIAG